MNKHPLDYHLLMVQYYADPLETRSVSKFCDDISLSRETFYKHLRENKEKIFYEADNLRKRMQAELRSEAFKMLAAHMKRNVNAVKIALEITGDYVQKTEQTVNLDPDAKRQKVEALLAKFGINKHKRQIGDDSPVKPTLESPDAAGPEDKNG
jgi:hypothetical protein